MFHLLFCLGPTWRLFSSGCPASFRGLPVQVSPSPAPLGRWGRGALSPTAPRPRVPLGWASFHPGGCRSPLRTGRPAVPRWPRTTGSPGPPSGATSFPTAPTGVRRGRRFSGGATRKRQRPPVCSMSPSPWAHGARPRPPPWARSGRLRVPGRPVPSAKSTETLRGPRRV